MTGIHKGKTENGIREILFRGKSSTTDEWVYGAFVPDAVESAKGMDFPVGYILWYNEQTGHMQRDTVERDTVGQFTGHIDENGKKIFEGDIVKCTDTLLGEEPYFPSGRVGFKDDAFGLWEPARWGWGTEHFYPLCGIYSTAYEIVGNIHDNPELCQG